MQPDDIKRHRETLGMTQQELADRLGVSRKSVNDWEAGRVAASERTVAMIHALGDQQIAIGNMGDEGRDGDVPLAAAVVLWQPAAGMDVPTVAVAQYSADDRHPDYDSSYGADHAEWMAASDAGRLMRLFALAHAIALRGEAAPNEIHDALWTIPEYRAAIRL